MDITPIDPFSLPSLLLIERSQLPNTAGIYFVLKGTSILYIGRTVNLVQRWAAHHKWSQLVKLDDTVKIAWLECTDKHLLPGIEAALIEQFSPELNGRKRKHIKSERVNVTLPDLVYEELEYWAASQGRPTANLAAFLIETSIKEAKERGQLSPPTTKEERKDK